MCNVLTISNTQVCKFANDDGTYRSLIITGLAGVKVDDCKIPHQKRKKKCSIYTEKQETVVNDHQ